MAWAECRNYTSTRQRAQRVAEKTNLPKDHRTLDQMRADVAADLLQRKETPAPLGGVGLYLTMPVTSLLGTNDDSAYLPGYGYLPAHIGRGRRSERPRGETHVTCGAVTSS
ncbi:hypothetical protein [Allokutzneria albata]|uniref:hypothetical protein n=1 Tax=Allokutzneria albata TaxID=211114 RepID=UPI0004C386C5|nr:hypothetical protein [Allokutzneria albata]